MSVLRVCLSGLFLFILFSVNVYSDSTRSGWTKTYLSVIEKALYKFYEEQGRFPTTEEGLGALIIKPVTIIDWRGPYFDRSKIPLDRWGNEMIYNYPSKLGNKEFDLYSLGANIKDDLGKKDDILSHIQ